MPDDNLPPLTDEELTALVDAEAGATAGEWVYDERVGVASVFAGQPPECLTQDCPRAVWGKHGTFEAGCWRMEEQDCADGKFIALSRNLLPRLLAELRRLRQQQTTEE